MDIKEFENYFLESIINNNNDCLNQIDNFKDLIVKCFGENENIEYIKDFINKLNNIILQKQNDFSIIETILNNNLFEKVLEELKKSDVLIKACINGNEEAAKWLLTMDINTCIRDINGMTALMHAVKKENLLSIVEILLNRDDESIDMEDNNGETALFHSINNMEALNKIINCYSNDINHLNKDKDNVLLYCCKHGIFEPIKILAYSQVDVNAINNEGKIAAMYLVENGRYNELELIADGKIDLDYRTEEGETVLSILIKKIYNLNGTNDPKSIIPFIKIFIILVKMDCNFNIPIDEEGNTPLMFFIMIKDLCSIGYLLTFNRRINVSINNKQGENAFSYSLRTNNKGLIERIMRHKSFNFEYYDKNHNNLLMNYITNNNYDMVRELLSCYPKFLNEVNNKQENSLIIATKLQNKTILKMLLTLNPNIIQQDNIGNTALHYAVLKKNLSIINLLAFSGADINIKNNNGQSPLDLAVEMNNRNIITYLQHPIKDIEDEGRNKKKKSLFIIKMKPKNKAHIENKNINVDSLTYSERKNIIKFELSDNKPKYSPLEPYQELFEIIKSIYNYNSDRDYSIMSRSSKSSIGNYEVSEKVIDILLDVVDIVGDVIN